MPASKQQQQQQQKQKQGGSLVSDIQNLAVPFAILLAKQGLDGVFGKSKPEKPVAAKKKTTRPSSAKAAPASKPASAQRRKTITGGSGKASTSEKFGGSGKASTSGQFGGVCSSASACAGMKGGNCQRKQGGSKNVSSQFDQVAKEIQSFLHKY